MTTPLFRKLQWKAPAAVLALDVPDSLEPALSEFASATGTPVLRQPGAGTVGFGIGFATTETGLVHVCTSLLGAVAAEGVLWIAYPKQSSKRYRCAFNRDAGWPTLGAAGYEPVRMVAIDDDWSALRFRPVAQIASFTRQADGAISEAGRQRARSRPH